MGVYFNKMKLLNAAAYGFKQVQFSGDVTVRPETVPQIRYDRPVHNDIGAYFFGEGTLGAGGGAGTDIIWPDDHSLCMETYGYDTQICSGITSGKCKFYDCAIKPNLKKTKISLMRFFAQVS